MGLNVVLSKSSVLKNCLLQHSRQSQSKRISVTKSFKEAKCGILVATDVVARGMDFPLVSHVFQMGVAEGNLRNFN